MIDLMLRFPDEAAAIAALPLLRGEEGWIVASHHHGLDPIGPMVTAPAVVDADGTVTTPAVVDERWHANLRLLDHPDEAAIVAACAPFVVSPPQPGRVWA